ncbi:MAG: alpha/beta fold hydrolase [Bradymonadales bacterium]|nr:alpha/beta fold hydrolase [Bradymonadales bacterium]
MNSTDWIDREEYPFESHYFQVPAGNLHYVDEGRGEPVVMIHGNPTWSFLYRNLIKRLRSEYRCIAPDHLGFGLSEKPPDFSYLPNEHAANLAALIEGLGLKNITLVVQDWGGPIGLSYSVSHPDNVARLIIMNTWAWPVKRDLYYVAFSGFVGGPIGRMLIRRYNFFAKSIMPRAFGDKRKLSAAAHEHYLRPLATPADRKGCLVFPKQIIASTPWLDQLWTDISRLNDTPKLIVWGMKDIAFREKELKRWERTFPEARTVRLISTGHYVQEEAPDELAEAVVPFLSEGSSA